MADCYIQRGGGAGLNFKVKAYSSELLLPATAAENTIAVITETPITGYAFAPTAPDAPAEGMVWFKTALSGSADFNALRKNKIFVSPQQAMQYVGGSWVGKTAKTYMNGAWVDWVEYLYNNGNVYTDITGGWAAKGTTYNGYGEPGAPSITYGENTLNISQTNAPNQAYSGFAYMKNAIDLTPYKSIVFTVTMANAGINYLIYCVWPYLPVSDSYKNPSWIAYHQAYNTTDEREIFMDVTGVNQVGYIGIAMWIANTVYIKQIRLERM